MAELDRRVLEGTPQKYNTANSRIHLEYLLLMGDGEEVSSGLQGPSKRDYCSRLGSKSELAER